MAAERKRRSTATSNFGVSRREGHDASAFYRRFEVPEISDDETINTPKVVDDIIERSSTDMAEVADNSVALVVTSPPYYAGKAYEEEIGQGHIPGSYLEYLQMLEDVFAECARTLEPGGRIAVNVANLGRRPYRSLSADVTAILQDRLKLLLRGEIIWVKAKGAGGNCAWGSFQQPSNPVLRDLSERIIVASKGRFDRAVARKKRPARSLPSTSTMFRDEFMELTTDVWEFGPESASRIGHPAPFPVELPRRLIDLYTYEDDLVLDPFMGSGSTAVAAVQTGRHFLGYDLDPDYIELARQRIQKAEAERDEKVADLAVARPRLSIARGDDEPADSDFQRRSVRDGQKAQDLAEEMLRRCGFEQVRKTVKVRCGVEVDFEALDHRGRRWFFDVSGAFSSSRPGLKRTDTLWKALGKASVLREHQRTLEADHVPFVLLTTDAPTRGSAGDLALRAVCDRGLTHFPTIDAKPIFDVIELRDLAAGDRLRRIAEGLDLRSA